MSKAFRLATVVAAIGLGVGVARAGEVAEHVDLAVSSSSGLESGGAELAPSPVAWTTPAQDRGAARSWRTWRSPQPGNSYYRPYVQWHSVAEEAARKAYWRGWYDRQRSAAGYDDASRNVRPPYPSYREGVSRYQPRRSVQTGSLAYRSW